MIDNTNLDQLIDFFEARYNLNETPYITYPSRVTNILYGDSDGSNVIGEAPFDGQLYARFNKDWIAFSLPSTPITNVLLDQWNLAYSWGDHFLEGYLTSETDPIFTASPSFGITSLQITNWDTAFGWGNHASAGYALDANMHDAVTLSTTNGLSLVGQALSLNLATTTVAGALSASDKTKLNNLIVQDAVTLGIPNGLILNGQELSLNLATTVVAGAMSAADKIKLDSLSNYIHATGFTNKPIVPLSGNKIISQVLINDEGHVTGITTREISLNTVGIVASPLTVTNDSNIELSLTGNSATSLLESVNISVDWVGNLSVARGGTGTTTLTNGGVLIGNGTSAITTISRSGIDTRTTFPATIHTLTSHSDVNISNPVIDNILMYNGTSWVNSVLDLSNITFVEEDPIFTAFRDADRNSNLIYAGPTNGSGAAIFRSLVTSDIPDNYLRFDISQTLTATQKQRVRTAIGAQIANAYEQTFSKGDIITNTATVISLTNATGRLVGISDLILDHSVSGWVDKTALTGAFIISDLTVDNYGHISDWTTRELTLADLGYIGFDPTAMQASIDDHETRITTLESNFPLLNGDKNFIHVQNTPSTTWTITHNLNKKPSITVIDSAGSMITGTLAYVDLNNVTLQFSNPTAGEAIFN